MGGSCDKYYDEDDDVPVIAYSRDLEALCSITVLKVRQQLTRDINECCRGNSYRLMDEAGQVLYRAFEYPKCNNCCSRWWCGPNRGFKMVIYDTNRRPILILKRKSCRFDFCCCLDCWTCANRIKIYDGDQNLLGKARQRCSCCHPKFTLEDSNNEVAGKLKGPCCPCRCLLDLKFNLFTPNGSGPSEYQTEHKGHDDYIRDDDDEDQCDANKEMFLSGFVSKKWSPTRERVNMDHENMEIYFGEEMDALDRALLIGSFFLVDFMYFEMS